RLFIKYMYDDEEANEILEVVSQAAVVEGIFDREPAPDLSKPTIVFLHGIMGGHLATAPGNRSWLSFLKMPFTAFHDVLGLDAKGRDRYSLGPDGIVQLTYKRAIRQWRRKRFRVLEFSYDWRKPIEDSADRLASFLEQEARRSGDSRFVLVAHSMGGLVCSLYAHRHSRWRDYVEKAIFCGSPLGGSFAISEILNGTNGAIRKLSAVSLWSSLEEMQAMGASFPGAIQMLPHPEIFPTAKDLYTRSVHPVFAQPTADWLMASENVKPLLRNSPILGKTTMLVSLSHPTVGRVVYSNGQQSSDPEPVRGDGTVPGESAIVDGVTAYEVREKHGNLVIDPASIEAIPYLINGDPITLRPVGLEEAREPFAEEAVGLAPSADFSEEEKARIERMREGVPKASDVRWLLDN
ncbi:MAG: alpha/beta hydrolase, partial [Verrucomicrobiota bacterium]